MKKKVCLTVLLGVVMPPMMFLLATPSVTVGAFPPFQFAPPIRYPTSELIVTFLTVGDFNKDGAQDLAVVNRGSNSVTILRNLSNGTGDLTIDATYSVGSDPRGIATGDIDGDGDLDLVTANFAVGADSVSILINTGTGAFLPVQIVALTLGARPRVVEFADLDNDGDLDLVTINDGAANISVLLNSGNGTFGPPINYPVQSQPGSGSLADLNHDGLIDLAVTNRASGSLTILLNQGAGVFNVGVNYLVPGVPKDQALGDLDRDGDLDVVVAVTATKGDVISIFLNQGNGAFAPVANYPALGRFPHAIALLDIDMNGILDVVVGNAGDVLISVFRGAGDGTLLPVQLVADGLIQIEVVTADFNGDGRPDLATADQGSHSASILLNTTPRSVPAGMPGDFNGDGLVNAVDLAALLVNWSP